MGTGYNSDGEWTGQLEETNGVRFGMGQGTVVDGRGDEAPVLRLSKWVLTAQPGHRLLIKGDSHREIKRAQKAAAKMAKRMGLTLAWRFCREITLEPRFITPEWTTQRVTEYQAWAVVRARDAGIKDRRKAWAEMLINEVGRDETESPSLGKPAWVYEMTAEGV